MRNKYFYPIFKLKAKSWIRYWLLKKTEFKGKLSEILTGFSFNLENTLNRKFKLFEIEGNSVQDGSPSPEHEQPIKSAGENGSITEKITNADGTEEQTYTIPVQAPFRSIENVRDNFVKQDGVWYERHNIGQLIIDENTSLTLESGDSFRLASSLTSNIVRPASQAVKPNLMTNYLQVITWAEAWAGKTGFISGNSSTNDFRFRVNANMTLEELRTWLSNHNIEVNYICIEPTLLPCTQSQIDILENLPITYEGQTNVYSTDEVEPYLKIQYWESDTNG